MRPVILFRVDTYLTSTEMNANVYDACALTDGGHRMPFDVFLLARCDEKTAAIARNCPHSIAMNPDWIELEQCRCCHSQAVNDEASGELASKGWFIPPMDGCPAYLKRSLHPASIERRSR